MNTGFDLNKWKEEAQLELDRLTTSEEELSKELAGVQIRKTELQNALGIKTNATVTRRRFRPKVTKWAESCDSVSSTAETIIEELFDGDMTLLDGLRLSLARLSKDNPRYYYDPETEVLSYPAEADGE